MDIYTHCAVQTMRFNILASSYVWLKIYNIWSVKNSDVILFFHLIIASFIVPTHEPGLARGVFLKFVFTVVVVLVADYQHV